MADLTGVLIKGSRNGKEVVFSADSLGTNIVIQNVPCESSVFIGAAVYMQGSGVAKNAIATSLTESNVIGFVESKSDLNTCNIRVLGVTPSIFAALDTSKEYFLSDSIAGQIVDAGPVTSGHILLKLGQPFSSTEFMVLKGTRVVRL